MAAKCPGCNKFASLEEPELEDSDTTVDGSTVTVTASVFRNSTCCGDEVKRADLEGDFEVDHDCPVHAVPEEADNEFELTIDPEWTPYVSGGARFQRAYVGVTGQIAVKCVACEELITIDVPEGIIAIASGDMEESA